MVLESRLETERNELERRFRKQHRTIKDQKRKIGDLTFFFFYCILRDGQPPTTNPHTNRLLYPLQFMFSGDPLHAFISFGIILK